MTGNAASLKYELVRSVVLEIHLLFKGLRIVLLCEKLLVLRHFAGPRSAVGKVSDCRFRGCEFDPRPVQYFCGDWSWNNFYSHSLPFRWFKKDCCQLQAKVCARSRAREIFKSHSIRMLAEKTYIFKLNINTPDDRRRPLYYISKVIMSFYDLGYKWCFELW